MDETRNGDNELPKADCHNNEDGDNIDVTSCSAICDSASSSGQNLHANLWNKFLKTISQQHETERKYPNPDVPEFYPRNMTATTTSYFNTCANSSDQTNGTTSTSTTTTTKCIAYIANNLAPKKDLVLMSQQCFAAATTSTEVNPTRDVVHGVTYYHWPFGEPCPNRLPRVIAYKSDRLEIDRTIKLPSSDHFQNELGKKDKQLLHLNNVVKALLEEIWRVNELLMKHKNKEQQKNDITFAIDGLLKPSSELGFHCDDCCDKFKQFVVKLFKQQERKFAKQQAYYKDMFIEYLVSIIENSLEAFSECGRIKYRFNTTLTKHDAATQTEHLALDDLRKPYKRPDTRRSKNQRTKIYRNRNFYKVYNEQDNTAVDASTWYSAAMSTTPFVIHQNHNERNRNKLLKQQFQPCAYSYSSQMYKTTTSAAVQRQPSFCDSQATNPIQLIHQKYKNLNCRLEGIPDKNLVKFSYIVNGKEYSAIASTKKEAQYHCAWHVLGATKQK